MTRAPSPAAPLRATATDPARAGKSMPFLEFGGQLTGRPSQLREIGEVVAQAVGQQHQQLPALCSAIIPSVT